MHPHTTVFTIITFLHDVFTALWIGGLATLGITVLPAVRKILGKSKQTVQFVSAVQKRQSLIIYISMAGLALTGFLMGKRNPSFGGLFSFENTYSMVLSIKHILMLLMIELSLYNSLVLHGNRIKLVPQKKQKLSTTILFLNIGCGVLILLLSSILSVMTATTPAL